jgi:phosphoglycolate phosphatase
MLIIFDLDGTLLNTIDDLAHACNHALMQSGFPTHAIEEYPALVGNGVKNLIRRALPDNERTEENVERVYTAFVPYYDAHNADYTRPYEGIVGLLQNLKKEGHTLAVASNKYQAATEKIVNQLFPSIFDVILGEREGIARKPDPQIVYDIFRMTNHTSNTTSSVLYVGDSLVDMETAQNAQLPFIACSWGFVSRQQLLQAGATQIIDHPAELKQFICK